jgi:hypothetical protein
MRRLHSLRITIPCVTGPYTSINGKVTLESNRERISTAKGSNGYAEDDTGEDPRFRYDFAARQSIVTSHGRSDSGRFALGADPSTYLPFEGAGAICRLRLDLPTASNAFDFDTISDVILTIEYTAREGGTDLRDPALDSLADLYALPSDQAGLAPPLQRLFSARHEFGQEWHAFLHPAPAADQVLTLQVLKEHLPYALRHKDLSVHRVDLYLYPKEGVSIVPNGLSVTLGLPEPKMLSVSIKPSVVTDGPAVGMVSTVDDGTPLGAPLDSAPVVGDWTLTVPGAATPVLTPAEVEDLLILMTYTATTPATVPTSPPV